MMALIITFCVMVTVLPLLMSLALREYNCRNALSNAAKMIAQAQEGAMESMISAVAILEGISFTYSNRWEERADKAVCFIFRGFSLQQSFENIRISYLNVLKLELSKISH